MKLELRRGTTAADYRIGVKSSPFDALIDQAKAWRYNIPYRLDFSYIIDIFIPSIICIYPSDAPIFMLCDTVLLLHSHLLVNVRVVWTPSVFNGASVISYSVRRRFTVYISRSASPMLCVIRASCG